MAKPAGKAARPVNVGKTSPSHADFLAKLGLTGAPLKGCSDGSKWSASGSERTVHTPIDGSNLATDKETSAAVYDRTVKSLAKAFAK